MSRRELTGRQFAAFQILRHMFKDLHEGVYGPRTWTRVNDKALKTVVLNLTNVNDISAALASYEPSPDKPVVDGQAVQKDGRPASDVP